MHIINHIISKIGKVRKLFELWDAAPDVANQEFDSLSNNHEAMEAKLRELLERKSSDEILALGAGYNYALIRSLYEQGYKAAATELVKQIVTTDLPIITLKEIYRNFGGDYVEKCGDEGHIIVPRQLDLIVFNEGASASVECSDTYLKKEGLAFLYERKVKLIMEFFAARDLKTLERKTRIRGLAGRKIDLRPTENVEDIVRKEFAEAQITDYYVLDVTNERAIEYLMFRYAVEKIGSHVPVGEPHKLTIVDLPEQ